MKMTEGHSTGAEQSKRSKLPLTDEDQTPTQLLICVQELVPMEIAIEPDAKPKQAFSDKQDPVKKRASQTETLQLECQMVQVANKNIEINSPDLIVMV